MSNSMRGGSAKFPLLASLTLAIATTIALSSPATAQTASDSTFLDTDWALTQFTTPGGGTSTGGQVLAGGNPGAFREITDALNAAGPGLNGVVLSTSIYTPFTYDPSVSGAITSLSYSEDAACTSGCFGQGQSTGPAVLQGGNLYILSSSSVITGPSLAWTNHPLSGLAAADFGLANVAADGSSLFDNTQHPDFSAGGAPIQFGFFRANGTSLGGGGYTLAAGIDNWQVTIGAGPPPPPVVSTAVPTLSEGALAALVLVVALIGFTCARRAR
ncbi:MAG: hypothetical protein ACHP7M_10905 [Burkholderiales bacterium]